MQVDSGQIHGYEPEVKNDLHECTIEHNTTHYPETFDFLREN